MARVGRSVNDGHMLCHIGEWRSHHSLILDKPSAEDEITIRRNFPRGMSKFLVIIENIRNGDTIKLSPYFFTDGGERYEIAEYVVLKPDGLFSTDDKIVAKPHKTRAQILNGMTTLVPLIRRLSREIPIKNPETQARILNGITTLIRPPSRRQPRRIPLQRRRLNPHRWIHLILWKIVQLPRPAVLRLKLAITPLKEAHLKTKLRVVA